MPAMSTDNVLRQELTHTSEKLMQMIAEREEDKKNLAQVTLASTFICL